MCYVAMATHLQPSNSEPITEAEREIFRTRNSRRRRSTIHEDSIPQFVEAPLRNLRRLTSRTTIYTYVANIM